MPSEPREGRQLPRSVGKRRTDDKEGVGHSQKPKVKTLEGALHLMSEMDVARLVGKHVTWRTARSYQITDGRGENTGSRVCVGTRIRVNPSHRKGTREQYDCLSLLGVRNKMPHSFSKPTFGPFQGPRDDEYQ